MNPETPKQTTGDINLDGVEAGLTQYVLKRWWKIGLSLLISAALFAGLLSLNQNPVYGIAPCVLYLAYLSTQYEKNLFSAFAKANGFSFKVGGGVGQQTGLIFSIGHDRSSSDIVSGPYRSWQFKLFMYKYTIGFGRYEQTFDRSVMEVDFGLQLPAFFLRRHKFLHFMDDQGESLRSNGYTEKLNLEGDFNKHFEVHMRPNTQIDVLSVLTPETMQTMVDLDKYELEMTDSGVFYIYGSYISKKQDLLDIYRILGEVTKNIGEYAARQKLLREVPAPEAVKT